MKGFIYETGTDRIHLKALCLLNEAAQRIQTEQDAADTAKETVQDISFQLYPAYIQAHHQR